ncbi:MAG: GNAT family N-acetyltransferase [Anaerolineae bacterium]|nr:GNAT family N-acetyltransferase [Anaerolineae bacterium]
MLLHTDRLTIRPYTVDDLQARHDLSTRAFQSESTLEDTRAWLTWTIASYQQFASMYQPPYGDYAIVQTDTQAVIGSVGLVPSLIPWGVVDELRPANTPIHTLTSPEFGLFWGILPEFWGNGYAPEAGKAFINHIFETQSALRVVATTEHDNLNSQRVMKKLGMDMYSNSHKKPFWFEVVGVLGNPHR